MTMSRFSLLLAAALILGLSGQAHARQAELIDPGPQVLTGVGGTSLDAAEVRAAIEYGARQRGWRVVEEVPGRVTLRIDPRDKHTVVVAVSYEDRGYRIQYVSSENMKFQTRRGKQYIHRNYNRWVANLVQAINLAPLAR